MFNGYNQPSYESDVGRENTLKKPVHAAAWNYGQSYYNNSDLQQSNSPGTWQQKLPYPNVTGKCGCAQCQQGPWYHKEVEPVVPSSANPDMMLLGPGVGGGGGTDYPMDTYPRPEGFLRNNVPVSKKFSSCSYPTPNSQMYSHRLPNIKQNVSDFTSFDRNSDQYMRMFEASSYGRKPVESRPKYWDSVNGGFYPPQQYQYPAPCRYPPYNPPFYYPNSNQSQSYQHPPQQNGIQQYYGIGPNPMRQMEVAQPMAHNYLKHDNSSKISPLRLMRKKKLAESVGQPSPPRVTQVTENTPALDVRRFLATWADEDEESPTVPQMVVLDCQDINAEQAELLRLYESSTSVRLVPESCIEQVTRSDSCFIPNKNVEEVVEEQPVAREVALTSTVPDDYSREEITPVAEVRETVIENQQAEESNGSPLPSPASTVNSQDSLPVLADLPTSEYRKNKFLDYDQQSFPLIPTKPALNETLAVNSCRLPPAANPTVEDTEPSEKKSTKKRSRKPTIKFSIQKSHDLKISLRVLNDSKSELVDQDKNIKNSDRKDEDDTRDLITVRLDGGEDDTQLNDLSEKRAKKLKRRRLLEQSYSVSSEDHCNDVTSDGFQVEESVDSAKIKLTFKRKKDQQEIPKKRKKAKRVKEGRDNKPEVSNSDWKATSPEGPPAADTTTDFYGQPPTQQTDPKLNTPLPSPPQFSVPDFPENVSSSPITNESTPSFTAFDQPDSSHENSRNKNTISQHSNTSSPKISSSCHITSPRTSTDSIERELQAIWSGRNNEIKFNEDDQITSNDNVVDFYTEDISTGPINIEPVKQESSEASNVSPNTKYSCSTSDVIEKECLENKESYIPVNDNLSEDTCKIFRSSEGVPNKIVAQCENENFSENNLSLTTLNAHSHCSDLSTLTKISVDNSSEIHTLGWQEPVLNDISPICNMAGKENNNIVSCDDRNEAEQVLESSTSDLNKTISSKDEIAGEAMEPILLENKVPVIDLPSDIATYHEKIIEQDVLQARDEKAHERSDIDTNLIDANLSNVTLAMKQELSDSYTHCIKSPPHLTDNESDDSKNEVCSSELSLNDNSIVTVNDDENFNIKGLSTTNSNLDTQQPIVVSDNLLISCNAVLEVERERLGPRTPDGSPSFLNSTSPPYSEYCESPYDTEITQAGSLNDNEAHSSITEISSSENISEEIEPPSVSDSLVLKDGAEDGAIDNVDREVVTPSNSTDLRNDEDTSIKLTMDFNTNSESLFEMTNKDSFDLNTKQLECDSDVTISKNCNYDVIFIERSLNLDDSCTEAQPTEDKVEAVSDSLFDINLECADGTPVNSLDLNNEKVKHNLDLKPYFPLVDINKDEHLEVCNSTVNKWNDSKMDFENKNEECGISLSLVPPDSTYSKPTETPPAQIDDIQLSKVTSIDLSTTENQFETHNLETYKKQCFHSADPIPDSIREQKLVTESPLEAVNLNKDKDQGKMNVSVDSIEKIKDQEGSQSPMPTSDSMNSRKDDSSVVNQTEITEYKRSPSLVSNGEKEEIIIVGDQVEVVNENNSQDSIDLNLTLREKNAVKVSISENDDDLTPPISPITKKPGVNINNSQPVSIIEDETKKTDTKDSDDSKLSNNDHNSSGDDENISENISKTFVTLNFISPLNSPHREENDIQLKVVEIESDKHTVQDAGSEHFNDYDSMESVELEADENANIIIGVDESSDLDDENRNEYFFEKPNDDADIPDRVSSPSDCNDVCTDFVPLNEEKAKLDRGEISEEEEEEEYIVVGDEYMGPVMMEDGVLFEIRNEELSSLDIKIEDIPLPPGDAPKQNCFDYSKWLGDNCIRDNLSAEKCVSPFTSDVLGMFRNPSPPGTPRMVMSPNGPIANESTTPPLISEVEETEEEADGLPDDAEFQHVMENCMANARKFLSGEIDDKRSDNGNEENVSRRDVLLSSFETHSDVEIGCEEYSAEVTIAFSPFNTGIASETLPVDNWPYLEEEVPLSPQWPLLNEEDIPLQDNECLESIQPTTFSSDNVFEKETMRSRNSNRLPRIRRRTFESSSNNNVRIKKFLSEREINESDNELEIFSDFKCHLSLDRLALKDLIGKKKLCPGVRKKSVESERKCKAEDFKGKKWQPKVVLTKMPNDKEPLLKFYKTKNVDSNKKVRSSSKLEITSDKSKVVENIENIPNTKKKLTLKEGLSEPHSKESICSSVVKTKGPAKLTLSNYKARCLSNQTKNNSISTESQSKSLGLKTQIIAKTQLKIEFENLQNEKKRHIEEKPTACSEKGKSRDKDAKIDRLDSRNCNNNANSLHKTKYEHVRNCSIEKNLNEIKKDVSDNKHNDKMIKVSDSSSKKCKEDGNHRIDKLESRAENKKSSHKKKVLKTKEIDETMDSNKKPILPCLSKKDYCKDDIYKKTVSLKASNNEINNKNEESPTNWNAKEVSKCRGSELKQNAHAAVDITDLRTAVDEDNSDDSEPWVCAVCGFDDLKLQQKHIQEHAFHCQGCHLAFISEDHFIKHLSKKHEDIRKIHHCLLCELSFETIECYNEHLQTREHKHLEEVEKSTIHTLFTLLCGEPCPVLGPVTEKPEWLPNQAGTVHFYHQATPLSLATQYWKKRQSSSTKNAP